MSGLKSRIAEAIRINGPMPVSLFMLMCLHDPKDGYYATRPGFNEDFTTAPETSQVFGELLGLWAAHQWIAMGGPDKLWLIELGPGRATMMLDMLRAIRSAPGFSDAVEIALVEASPALRRLQMSQLEPSRARHFDSIQAVPPGPAIIIGNEYIDCMPVRQFVRDANGWRERQIGLDANGELRFGLGPPTDLPGDAAPAGDSLEVSPGLDGLAEAIAHRFQSAAGRALFIDYGTDVHSPGDTLRAFQTNAQIDPLADPGASDLTADVDFVRLKRLAETRGLSVHGPVEQGCFLSRLGAHERARALAAANPERAEQITAAVKKLVAPDQMGSRFKAICLAPQGAPAPPGF